MEYDISVIVPVHNAENYMHIAMNSLLNQHGVKLQIILVENGSIDESKTICEKYAKENNNVEVYSLKEGNVSLARNEGVRQAKGRYISFVDADDYIKENMYQELLYNQDVAETEIIFFDYYRCIGEKQEVGDVLTSACSRSNNSNSAEALIKAFIGPENESERNYMATVWRAVFKREFLIKNMLTFHKELKIGEDLMFLVEALSKTTNIVVLDKVYYYYVVQNNSVTSKITEDTWDKYSILLNHMIDYFKDSGNLSCYVKRIQRKQQMFCGWIIDEIAKSEFSFLQKRKLIIEIYDSCDEIERKLYEKNDRLSTRNYQIMIFGKLVKGYLVRIRGRLYDEYRKKK